MSNIASIIEKVRRLLALAYSSNANEAAAATAKANQLIDEYRLSVDQLTPQEQQESAEKSDDPLLDARRAAVWQTMLASRLSHHYGCYIWRDNQGFRIAGRRSDMDILRYMFAYISSECMRLSTSHSKGKGRTYAESYRRGFIDAVTEKLAESRQQAKQAATHEQAQGLIKLDDRSKDAEKLVRQSVKLGGPKTTYIRVSPEGKSAGQAAGRNMHLGAALTGGNTRLLNK